MTKSSQPHRRQMMGLAAATLTGAAVPFAARASEAPALPTTPMPEVAAYAGSPGIDEIAISPDGTRVALVTQRGDNKFLIDYIAGQEQSNTVNLGPAKIRNLSWADNDHVILTNSHTADLRGFAGAKHEFFQARTINLATKKVRLLFDHMDRFYPIVVGRVRRIKTADGYRAVASNYRMDGVFNECLYSFRLEEGPAHLIYEGSGSVEDWVLTPDGFLQAYSEFDDVRKEWALYCNSGTVKNSHFKLIYKVKDAGGWPSLIGLGRDGTSLVLFVPKALNPGDNPDSTKNYGDYFEITADGALSAPIDVGDDGRDRRALFHPKTGRLAGFSRHDDGFVYDYFDPLMKKLAEALPVVMGTDYRAVVVDFAEDPRKMIIYGESPNDAGSYYYSDFSTGTLEFIAQNYELPAEWITQKQPLDYKAADGLNIHAYLTLPPLRTAKNLPLVVVPHGGPQARDTASFDWQAQVLASRGYAVLQPNFRGSEGYGDAFVEAGKGEWGRKMQTDLSDGVRHLAKDGMIDPKRVAILGASYGGYAALAGATLDTGIYRCAVSIAGISDVKALVEVAIENAADNTNSDRVLYLKRFLGDKTGWPDISPAKQAARADCPVLLIHGTDDTVVPIDQSRSMEKALKAAGKPVEFVTYKGQDHWETVGSSRVEMMKVALAFLDKYNPA